MSNISNNIFTPQPTPIEPSSQTSNTQKVTELKATELTTKKIVASTTSGLFGFGLLATAGLATGMTAGILPLALAGGVALGSTVGFFANKFFDTSKKDASENFNNLLKNIEEEAKTDLYLNDEFIEKKFEISKALAPLSDTEQRQCRLSLQKIVNHAYLTQALKKLSKFNSKSENEMLLLDKLNFNVSENSPYHDKKLITEKMVTFINQEIIKNEKSENFRSLSSLEDSLKNKSLNIRLDAAGIDNSLQIEKFKTSSLFCIELKKLLKASINDISIPLPENFPFSADSDIIHRHTKSFNFFKDNSVSNTIKNFCSQFKDIFFDDNIGLEEFQKLIEEKQKILLSENTLTERCKKYGEISPRFSKEINHYEKWGKYFKCNLIQGAKNLNDVLDLGLCMGFAYRIISSIQDKPNITLEELTETIKITSKDRFYQATKEIFVNYPYTDNSYDIFHADNYIEKHLGVSTLDNNNPVLAEGFDYLEKNKLLSSPGMLLIGVANHCFPVRWDIEKNCYWVIDSNQGLLCFENSLTSSEDAKALCIEYLNDLIKNLYPSTTKITFSQYQDKRLL